MRPSAISVASLHASTSALTLERSSGSRYMSKIAHDVAVTEFRALCKVSARTYLTYDIDRYYSLRPYGTEILGRDSRVVEPVHLKKHFMPLSKEAATPEWVIAISTDGRLGKVLSRMPLPNFYGVQYFFSICVCLWSKKPRNAYPLPDQST